MTYFAIIAAHKQFQTNLEVSEVLITYVTNRWKATVMLHIGADHSNNCQKILVKYCSYMRYFAIICSMKTILSKFGGIRGINHICYKSGEG